MRPEGVRPCRPAAWLPKGKADPAFAAKPELAWGLIDKARAAGVPFRAVVADCVYGENPKLEGRLRAARIRYVLALRPSHGTWQAVDDPAHPPAFTPAETVARLPLKRWQAGRCCGQSPACRADAACSCPTFSQRACLARPAALWASRERPRPSGGAG